MNIDLKKINSNLLVNTGLNIVGKKIKNRISQFTRSGVSLTINEVKYIIKVIIKVFIK